MIEVVVGVDEKMIADIRKRLGNMENKTPTVLVRAINRTITNIKKNMAEQTGGKAGRYNIKSETVKNTLDVHKATRQTIQGSVISDGSPILLAEFNAKMKPSPDRPVLYKNGKPSPKFYSVAVKKGSRKPLKGSLKAFIAPMKPGLGFLQRVESQSYPLAPLYGPSVPQMIENKETMAYIQKDAQSTLEKRIDAEINNILRKG